MNKPGILDNIRIVLSHTSHPGNIGAAARAMKTMGFNSLYLINPKHFPDGHANAMSAGADDLLVNAVVCTSLDEALEGTTLAVAVTARHRDLSHAVFTTRQAAPQILENAVNCKIALVFGTEMSGLTNEEVNKCQMLVTIPSNPEYSSLNLAAAVQILTYELRMTLPETGLVEAKSRELAQFEDVERFYNHLEQVMVETGFLDPNEPKRLMQRMRRLFVRAQLEKEEVNILRGILSATQKVD
ncbi:RNA methyltransferase [Sulfurirhabdus autotrophica]|uniref:tRNA (cytidine/uridine-2'-O-)-methyltransferase TrmJ n=1 Tax=Sulfurirhabdus autotrophica TaxID=1706046 RepID=A0A4R3YIC6_9PROT|nr:RNA methyltransferase [Sulfurirhabdus autotrophica]TCV90754.1 tRNA/rRNA methyltransferase [Sulfurirhabdus autotrophica]